MGILISWSASLEVGSQNERRPSGTREREAKFRMSVRMEWSEYGRFGGM